MKELLPILPRPTRYLGSEWGVFIKPEKDVQLRVALGFPDMYEVGMSYLGQRILLESVNQREGLFAERVYTPCEEVAAILREKNVPLATLETDTPLGECDVVSFSLTHELCYTNILFMLDLAGIPLRSEDRDDSHPLIIAGGGACYNAEPVAPFIDIMNIGDGEKAFPDMLEAIAEAKKAGKNRAEILDLLAGMPGVYIPSFFEFQGPGKPLKPLKEGYERIDKAIVEDLNDAPFPLCQPVSFGQAVHDRLTLEIARGCTRGCRFCQAGMIYRPVRERSLDNLDNLLFDSLEKTGYEETSFLSLSTGDFSGLDTLFSRTFDRCAEEQISISLPSLRVGSLSAPIMERISSIRRTGATIAPEAGSQRLRDVINKGVDEESLIAHVKMLMENGWHHVKLYFMIGLPTETDEDLDAIVELCRKVRDACGWQNKKLQVTAAVSPFVPKPQTPFQWEQQIPLEEMKRRIYLIKDHAKRVKRVMVKSHIPQMSYLEGIFSRGDRRLADVVLTAYQAGALFSSWKDKLDVSVYLDAMKKHELDPAEFLAARDIDAPLPWDHINSGLTKQFFLKERERALAEKVTEDCRYHACRNCGVCDFDGKKTTLERKEDAAEIKPRLIFESRDQEGEQPPFIPVELPLNDKEGHFRIWYNKLGPAAYLSQLEMQSVLERSLRRADVALSFSAGFHPMPRLSFGRALPVGVESRAEWVNIFTRVDLETQELAKRLNLSLPKGLQVTYVERLDMGKKQPQATHETYEIEFQNAALAESMLINWRAFAASEEHIIQKMTKKGKPKDVNLRSFLAEFEEIENGVRVKFDWREGYMSPVTIAQQSMGTESPLDYQMTKIAQTIPNSKR